MATVASSSETRCEFLAKHDDHVTARDLWFPLLGFVTTSLAVTLVLALVASA